MKEKIITRNFVCTFLAQLCLALVMYTLMSTITEHVTKLGATTTIAGLVSGVYVVGGLFSRIYSGGAMQKYGWKKIAVIFSIIHFVSSIMYSFSGNIALLLVVRFIHGIGFGATMNAIMLIAMSSMPKSRYGEATGYFMMSASLGVAIGPFVGGIIYDTFGGQGCFTVASILSLLVVFGVLFSETRSIDPYFQNRSIHENRVQKSDKVSEKATVFDHFLERKAIPISLSIFCLCFGYAALMSFYRLYAQSTDLRKEFSYFFLIYAAVLLVSRPAVGKLQDKIGDNAICYPCMAGQVIGLILLAWKPCMATIIICAVCGALGYGTLNSVLNVIVNRQVTDEERSRTVTTYWAFSDAGVGIAPAILGKVASAFGYPALYFAAAAISFLAIPIYWLVQSRKTVD